MYRREELVVDILGVPTQWAAAAKAMLEWPGLRGDQGIRGYFLYRLVTKYTKYILER